MRIAPFLIAALFYAFATRTLWNGVALNSRKRHLFLFCSGVALAAQLLGLYIDAYSAHGVYLHFFAALSWVSAGMVGTLLIALGTRPVQRLGVVIFPIAMLTCVLAAIMGAPSQPNLSLDNWQIAMHAVLALAAFATLAVAALVAVMLNIQDRALRARHLQPWMQGAPPLTEVESLLFQLIGIGFGLLSLTLATGIVFVSDLFAQHLVHKTVLAISAWLVFGILLAGRWHFGWRGQRAIRMALIGFLLLALAYLGSKFVLEMILKRTL